MKSAWDPGCPVCKIIWRFAPCGQMRTRKCCTTTRPIRSSACSNGSMEANIPHCAFSAAEIFHKPKGSSMTEPTLFDVMMIGHFAKDRNVVDGVGKTESGGG